MTAIAFCTAQSVRDYLELNSPGSTSKYTDATINSNIRAASFSLERATGRWFADRPATTWTATSNGRASLFIPGFRNVTSVTIQTAPLTLNGSYWLLADSLNTGIYTAIQLRAFTSWSRDPSRPWLANPNWFDINADSPWYPPNYGGGYNYTSLPNDLVISGDGGYADVDLPEPVRHAAKVLAAFYTKRPDSILADVAITPAGGVLNYSQMPPEVRDFIEQWRIGDQAVSV